jgi:hypothetical protein
VPLQANELPVWSLNPFPAVNVGNPVQISCAIFCSEDPWPLMLNPEHCSPGVSAIALAVPKAPLSATAATDTPATSNGPMRLLALIENSLLMLWTQKWIPFVDTRPVGAGRVSLRLDTQDL